jgi:hypothetical protein
VHAQLHQLVTVGQEEVQDICIHIRNYDIQYLQDVPYTHKTYTHETYTLQNVYSRSVCSQNVYSRSVYCH